MASRWYSVVVDAIDPIRLGRWWADVLGYQVLFESPQEVVIAVDGRSHPGIVFVPVPEDRHARSRLHIDLNPDDQRAEVERLVNMGARQVDGPGAARVVLTDPEGNEFCLLTARTQ